MGGGPSAAWDRVAPILEAIAAKFEGTPCATWMGTGRRRAFRQDRAQRHRVCRHADDRRDLRHHARRPRRSSPPAIAAVFEGWNAGPLKSYLVEITGKVCARDRSGDREADRRRHPRPRRPEGHRPLDGDRGAAPRRAGDRDRGGGGRAQPLGAPRRAPGRGGALRRPAEPVAGGADAARPLEAALLAGKIACYAQGFGILAAASQEFGWSCRSRRSPGSGGPAASSARRCSTTWRGRSQANRDDESDVCAVASPICCGEHGEPARGRRGRRARRHRDARRSRPGSATSTRCAPSASTANLLQAQRDFFGAHGFERVDQPGAHHGPWAVAAG